MPEIPCRRLLLHLPVLVAAGAGCGTALAEDDAPAPLRAAALQPAPGVVIQYDLNTAAELAGRLQGVLRDGWGEWRTRLRVDPAQAVGERVTRLETRWQAEGTGGAPSVVVGDTFGSGGGWSRPVRIGGFRIGRELRLRPGFDAGVDARVAGSAALPASSIASDANVAIDALGASSIGAPALVATDYELEAGRLRSDAGTVQERYGAGYAAGAWRTALLQGLSAETRAEWTPARTAGGVELAAQLGRQGAIQAVLAHSEAGGEAGLRRGVSIVRNADGVAWTLGWDDHDRGYTPLALAPGEAEARTRLQAGAAFDLFAGVRAGLTYGRQSTWGTAPAQVLGLAGRIMVAQRGTLSLSYSLRSGDAPDHRLGFTLSMPLMPSRL
jgi:outer membrane usher protein FimD/PapC